MGQKVNPNLIRLDISTKHIAQWYAEPKDYPEKVKIDLLSRSILEKELKSAGVSSIIIAFTTQESSKAREGLGQMVAKIAVYVARPGVVIGKKGEGPIESVKKKLEQVLNMPVYLSVKEIRRPELDAKLVAENIANQLVRRINHRRAIKRAIDTAMKMGALGIKVMVSGRLGGTDIARAETVKKGRIPLHEFRALIDYANVTAHTISGAIGVTVTIHKKTTLDSKSNESMLEYGARGMQSERVPANKSRLRTYPKKKSEGK
jgi:small subunit ribosomal protein S3